MASFVSYTEHVSSLEWYTEASPCQVEAGATGQRSSHEGTKDTKEDVIARRDLGLELELWPSPLLWVARSVDMEEVAEVTSNLGESGGGECSQFTEHSRACDRHQTVQAER